MKPMHDFHEVDIPPPNNSRFTQKLPARGNILQRYIGRQLTVLVVLLLIYISAIQAISLLKTKHLKLQRLARIVHLQPESNFLNRKSIAASPAKEMIVSGVQVLQMGNFAQARKAFEAALRSLAAPPPELYYFYGLAELKAFAIDTAIERLHSAELTADPCLQTEAYWCEALAHLYLGQGDSALADLNRVIASGTGHDEEARVLVAQIHEIID